MTSRNNPLDPFSLSDTSSSSEEDSFSNTPFQQPAKPVKTRKRGFSLRTQLFNKNITQAANESYQPDQTQQQQQRQQDQAKTQQQQQADIELLPVDNSYAPDDLEVFRNDSNRDNSRPGYQFVSDESIIDLDQIAEDRIRQRKGKYKKPNVLIKYAHKFMGITDPIPSVGGRRIPISIDLNHCDLPTDKNTKHHRKRSKHSNQPLLIDERTNSPYCNNLITSSRYTFFSFIPRQLIAQFSKLANCYFMTVAIMQLIPSWSTTGTTSTIIPLSIFITISILREGFDDFRRHRLDKTENTRVTKVLAPSTSPLHSRIYTKSATSMSFLRPSGQSFDLDENCEDSEDLLNEENSFANEHLLAKNGIHITKTRWKNVKVGQIVRLDCDDWVPADMVLLTSSNVMGEAFIETMALDGETNLKSKIPNNDLHKLTNKVTTLSNLTSTSVLTEDPNLDLYNFEGSLDLPDLDTHELKKYPLGPDNVLYRGSILRNTESCLGLVIFTGEETKIRMNAIKNPRIKAPKIQRSINMIVAFMVTLVVSISAFSLMAQRIYFDRFKVENWYIYGQDAGVAATFMGFIIMFNTMIPLSLYVTMEIIKVMQMILLQWDIDMYHKESNTPAEARTATILEELGQVSYIFSDKTGTLTDNQMIFRKFSVAGTPWIHDIDLLTADQGEVGGDLSPVMSQSSPRSTSPARQGSVRVTGRPSMALSAHSITRPSMSPSLVTAKTAKQFMSDYNENKPLKSSLDLIRYIQADPNGTFSKKVKFFLLSLAVCHTCIPRKVEKKVARESTDSLISIENAGNNTTNTSTLATTTIGNNAEDDGADIEIDYQASSPDELALVQAASDMGFIFWDKKQKNLTLKLYPNGFESEPEFENYEILETVDFTSARKRMSVVVKFPDGQLVMLCKGADNIILERLRDTHLVSKKQNELTRNVSSRKKNEAELILQKNHEDGTTSPTARVSTSSLQRMSSQLSRSSSVGSRNSNVHGNYGNIDSILGDQDEEINGIKSQSRKSMQLKQKDKYNFAEEHSYVPSDQLISNDEFVLERTLQHIEEFSSDGLRTLMYSYRYLDDETFTSWSNEYAKAKTSLHNRAENISEVGCRLENNLELLGCTAIEDKLQEGVPEAIEKLRRAGIRLWMLTGDKRETAINIGYACKLIKDYSTVVILSNEIGDTNDLSARMNAAELEIDAGNVAHCVIVVDGSTLSDIESDLTLMSLFISLGVKANSVICCRASPSQKAKMVESVRRLDKSKVTLAIGDGANDIAMIQSADVGVGITGKEGLQAARTSDYSIAQFRYLLKLLLVHGRYNYIRTSKFVLCTFYKELLFYLTQLLYQRYTLFTGSSLYESWSLSMFNTLFTSLPVLCIGMFDKDLRPSTLIAVPELYSLGRNYESFNMKLYLLWVFLAATQSTTLAFSLWSTFGFNALIDNTTYPLGVVLFTVLIIIINTKCNIIEMHSITKICLLSWCVSVFGWLGWCVLLAFLYRSRDNIIFYVDNGLFEHFGKDVTFWATILVLSIVGLSIDFVFQIFKHTFFKTDTDVFQILEKIPDIRKKMELNAFEELRQSWTWPHESQIVEQDIESYSNIRRNIYNFRSFLKKGSIHPSKATQYRKRKGTLVNPTELPPDAPSIVQIASTDRYRDEMLPSGKIIRQRLGGGGDDESNDSKNRLNKVFKKKGKESDEENESIEHILDRRMRQLEEE